MLKRVWVPLLLASIVFLALPIQEIKDYFPRHRTWNQKLTLHINTPEGLATASSVGKLSYSAGHRLYDPIIVPSSTKFEGEAIVAKLGSRYLFVLNERANIMLFHAWRAQHKERITLSRAGKYLQRQETPLVVPIRDSLNFPRFVTFEDLTDPTSVRLVDPLDLASIFGEVISFKKLTISVTNEDVAEDVVEGLLEWLSDVAPGQLDGSRFENLNAKKRFANSISPYLFSTELRDHE